MDVETEIELFKKVRRMLRDALPSDFNVVPMRAAMDQALAVTRAAGYSEGQGAVLAMHVVHTQIMKNSYVQIKDTLAPGYASMLAAAIAMEALDAAL
jgi:hypothetical protein